MSRNGTGIYERHSRTCPAETVKARSAGAKCNCTPTYRVRVWSPRDGKRIDKSFPTKTEARQWQPEAKVEIRKGTRRAPMKKTVANAFQELLVGMKDGSIRSSARAPYKPATIRSYGFGISKLLETEIASRRVGDLERPDLQRLFDRLSADGASVEVLNQCLNPLRVVYRRALRDGEVGLDPTEGLELPVPSGNGRDRIVAEDDAARLIAATDERDQGIWATAFYAGLRVGEIQGLDCGHIEPDPGGEVVGWIKVERQYDHQTNTYGTPKSEAGIRLVPILDQLAPFIQRQLQARQELDAGMDGPLFFGSSPRKTRRERTECLTDGCHEEGDRRGLCTACYRRWWDSGKDPALLPPGATVPAVPPNPEKPFDTSAVQKRATRAWKKAGLERVTFHTCRHTFISILFSRLEPEHLPRIQRWAGHANLTTTLNTYTHLVPGSEVEALRRANAQLPMPPPRAERRVLQLGPGGDEEDER